LVNITPHQRFAGCGEGEEIMSIGYLGNPLSSRFIADPPDSDEMFCVCGHTDEDHFNDGGDETSKIGCEAWDNDGMPCACDDFTHPLENYED
jgi:hypothetical protein